MQEAGASQREAAALRHALSTVEAKLTEYQHKDAEVGRGVVLPSTRSMVA